MDLLSTRCGCGATFRQPSLKSRNPRCPDCDRAKATAAMSARAGETPPWVARWVSWTTRSASASKQEPLPRSGALHGRGGHHRPPTRDQPDDVRRAHARGQILHEAIEQQGTAGGVRQVGELDDSFRQRIKASLRAGVDRLTAPTPVEQARIAADLAIYLHDFAGEGFQEDVPVFTATPELQKRWGQGKDDPPPAPQPGSLFAIVEALEKLIWVTSARAKEGPGPFEATVTIRSAYPPGEAEKYSAHLTFKDAAPCGVAPSFVWQWDEPNPRDA